MHRGGAAKEIEGEGKERPAGAARRRHLCRSASCRPAAAVADATAAAERLRTAPRAQRSRSVVRPFVLSVPIRSVLVEPPQLSDAVTDYVSPGYVVVSRRFARVRSPCVYVYVSGVCRGGEPWSEI